MASSSRPLPLAKQHGLANRIKRIMQSDEDVGKVAAASTHLVGTLLSVSSCLFPCDKGVWIISPRTSL